MTNIKVQRTGASDYGRFIKALICGSPGAGKTLISSTFPNPMYASAEGGLMSIADRNIPYVKVESSHDLLAVKHAVDQVPAVREQLLGFPVDTVVIDTIDEVQRILIRERLEETKKDSMSLPDWGWLGEQMQAIIRGFRNLDLNVVFTCHMKEVQDNDSGRVWFEPGLQGAISKQISAYVDLALLLRSQTRTKVIDNTATQVQERMLVTRPDVAHEWVKDRSGKLPTEIEVNFLDDYDRLADLIFGKIDLLPVQEPVVIATPAEDPEPTVVEEPVAAPVVMENVVNEVVGQPRVVPVLPNNSTVNVEAPLLSAEKTEEVRVCDECGVEVGADQADLSKIRFRKVLCREHHASMKRTRA
jgi:hypothetical protein